MKEVKGELKKVWKQNKIDVEKQCKKPG